ncbi:FYVE zinc finger-domain-containing protein [Amylostereum chailletii]|nr:FYVE zinc finger-domain-containing protein [Amylostereum chailletii]
MASSPSHVPYQAYRSKRHSRTPSNLQSVPPSSPPSRPSSALYVDSTRTTPPHPSTNTAADSHALHSPLALAEIAPWNRPKPALAIPTSPTFLPNSPPATPTKGEPESSAHLAPNNGPDFPATTLARISNGRPSSTTSSPTTVASPHPQSSTSSSKPIDTIPTRRTSTFRYVPLRNVSAPSSPSPLRPTHSRVTSLTSRQLEPLPTVKGSPRSRLSTLGAGSVNMPSQFISSSPASQPQPPPKDAPSLSLDVRPHQAEQPPKPPTKSPSPRQTPAITPAVSPAPVSTSLPRPGSSTPVSRTTSSSRTPAPYRPGFQPKGVYRPRTDEFLEARRARRDVGRVDRTRLERRLEKLISLHFGPESEKRAAATVQPRMTKRMSSIFDLDVKDLKNLDAGDLWKGVVSSQPAPGSKADIRSAEQSITPWEKDPDVSQCPLCSASFHPITNRKHHCRLCGKIICSLPVKRPQRPDTCSLLFVADPQTGKIEEVGEGVDYGVRKRTMSTSGKTKGKDNATIEEKFLKGVRICRECRPVLLRQQYISDVGQVPTFAKLYQLFIGLEKDIEEALPLFQELLLTLSNDDRPTAEASAARKRLLEAFAQYDAIAKRIRRLPTPGPGSSQDRVQAAIVTRANVFLQKHMFPLQSLPKPKKASSTSSPASTPEEPPPIDPDSEIAHALQPLLEQEALLETFVEEAKAHRKFEDAKTLKTNLAEIRSEIDRIMANAPNGRT